jgi:hypothetical protein
MGHQGALDQRRINPTKRRDIVGMIWRTGGEWADSLRQDALDRAVSLVQMARGSKGLIQPAEHEREGDVECSVKPADGIGQCAGMLGDRRSDARVGELEQEPGFRSEAQPLKKSGFEHPFQARQSRLGMAS